MNWAERIKTAQERKAQGAEQAFTEEDHELAAFFTTCKLGERAGASEEERLFVVNRVFCDPALADGLAMDFWYAVAHHDDPDEAAAIAAKIDQLELVGGAEA